MTVLINALFAAALAVLGRLVSQTLFEAVLIRLLLAAGERLAAMTSNGLDDALLALVRARLTGQEDMEARAERIKPLLAAALLEKNYTEYARLSNEIIGTGK